MTASITVTQVLAYAEIGGDTGAPALVVSQALAYAEIGPPQRIDVTQLLVYVEIDNAGPQPGPLPQTGTPASPVAVTPGAPPAAPSGGRQPSLLRRTQAALQAARAAGVPGTLRSRQAAAQHASAPSPAAQSAGLAEYHLFAAKVEIDWSQTDTWVDESANLVSVSGESALTAPQEALTGGKGQVDRCTITLHNNGYRYSTLNEDSDIYAYIGDGASHQIPVRVTVTLDSTDYRLFTGAIRTLDEAAPNATQVGTVTLDCRSRDDVLLQQRTSTLLTTFQATLDAAQTEDVHIIALLTTAGMVDGTDFVSQAYADAHPGTNPTIDRGVFPISYVWLDDESPLEELWQLVGAGCGWFYADADGKLHYHNLAGLLDAMLERQYGVQTEVDISAANVVRLALGWRDNDLYSAVTVETAPRGPGSVEELWTPDEPIVVQPGETKTIWARLAQPLVAVTAASWTARTASGLDISSAVSLVQTNYVQRVKLVWTNSGAHAAYISDCTITGQALIGQRSAEVSAEVDPADPFWAVRAARTRSIRNNVYIQTDTHAQTVAAYVLARSQRPQLVATVSNLDQPGVRVGRKCALTYSGVIGATTEFAGLVTTSRWRLTRAGFAQDVTVMDVTRLFAGYEFFVLGAAGNVLGASGDPDEAYLFY